MKKVFFAAVFFCLSVLFRITFAAPGTCGDNVKYEIEGNTITFSKEDPAKEAVWDNGCGEVFRNNADITVVKVSKTIKILNGNELFSEFPYVREMYLSNLDVSEVTDMRYMFSPKKNNTQDSAVTSLTTLDLHGWDTSNVTDMTSMFAYCSSLQTVNVDGWDTSNVKNMDDMFCCCESLKNLDLNSWDTSNVESMFGMFQVCLSLEDLQIGNWITSSVKNMGWMFHECKALTSLDVSKWDTSAVTDMSTMFAACESLKMLDVSKWNTANVTDMESTFGACYALEALDVSKWDTSNVTKMENMFYGCGKIKSLDVSGWKTDKVTDMHAMFEYCSSLTALDVSGWNTSSVKNMAWMFSVCESLTGLDVSGWDTSAVNSMFFMFARCGFTDLDLSKWNISNVRNMESMFNNNKHLESLNISGWNISDNTNMNFMFGACPNLKKIDLGNGFRFLDTVPAQSGPNGTEFRYIFPYPGSKYTGNWINKERDLVLTPADLEDTYDGASMSGTWVWEEKAQDLKLTAMNSERTYNGKPLVSEASATVTEGTVITFSVDNGATWNSERPEITDAGTLSYLAKAENPSYPEPVTGEGTLTVHPKQLEDKSISFRLDPKEVNYDGKEHEVAYSVYDAERETELIDGFDYEILQDSSVLKGTEPGTYKVVISADDKAADETEKSVTGNNYIGKRSAVWEIIDTSIHMYRLDFPRDLCDRCSLPATGISSAASAAVSDRPRNISYGSSGLTLQIPSLSAAAEIVTVPFTENEWPVNGLGDRAGLLEGTAFPGEGYSIIAAHNTLGSDEVGPFGALAAMKENDKIFINGPRGNDLRYSVYANELIEPDDFRTIADIAEQKPGSLILVTCENESPDGVYLNRRVIFAEPQ